MISYAYCALYTGEKVLKKEFFRLGELQSVLFSNVRTMALTTLATKQLHTNKKIIIQSLGMLDPVVVPVPISSITLVNSSHWILHSDQLWSNCQNYNCLHHVMSSFVRH